MCFLVLDSSFITGEEGRSDVLVVSVLDEIKLDVSSLKIDEAIVRALGDFMEDLVVIDEKRLSASFSC